MLTLPLLVSPRLLLMIAAAVLLVLLYLLFDDDAFKMAIQMCQWGKRNKIKREKFN